MKSAITPEPALLGFLRAEPLHGYDLHKRLHAELGGVWRLGLSQLYAILKEYETRGYIQTVSVSHNGRPARKMLKLTPAGARAFDAWMNESAHGLREFRVDFFVRLYFARAAGRAARRTFLTKQIKATQKEYDALAQNQPTSDFGETVRDFRRTQLQSILNWLVAYQALETRAPLARQSKRKLRPRR